MEERILSLRRLLNLSQKDFANKISITQAALSQIESGKTMLSVSTMYSLIRAFELRTDWLLFGQGEIFSHQKIDTARGTPPNSQNTSNQLIPFVDKDAEAGYPDNCADSEYIKTLGAYRIPGFEEGKFRMFNISGDSMHPHLCENEVVITEAVDKIESIQENQLCVIISSDGIVAKRVFHDNNNTLLLKSDNPKYKAYKLAYSDVIEIWEIKGKITTEFLNKTKGSTDERLFTHRLEELEKTVDILKSALKLDGRVRENGELKPVKKDED
ncbi:transcriptional regulator with XRE-family HTH domain [Catalinimonas alkaloidigena]|uniref:XRE family transcriptional regulator n=1 Tax=Catalinimonas alkaloidigena TaxID=1075417 RepID=UPI0024071BEB|nr:LexA family transcriptional regulator [Catalinimonas alkaloidigena]MDF9800356.1 transcriptional regulator with XRE-family HTH domain [Catalinimonas alkaloidigena]